MTNIFHALMLILLVILTILDISNRGIPVTWSNFTVINIGMIFAIIFDTLDIATKGKYRKSHYALTIYVLVTILSTICVIAYFNF